MTQQTAISVLDASERKDSLQDQPGEGRLLAALFQYGLDGYIEIEGILSEDTFTDAINQILWKCAFNFFELEQDKPTFASIMKYADALGYKNFFEKKDEKDYLKSLFNLPVELQDCKIVGIQLKKLQVKREFFNKLEIAANNLIEVSTLEPLSKIVGAVEEPLNDYIIKMSNFGDEGKFLKDHVDVHVLNLYDNPNTVRGIQTGFSKYDYMIGGSMEPGTLHVIVARSGVGKSIHAANTAINAAKNGNFVILADLELDENMTLNRMLASISGVSGRKFSMRNFTEEDKDKINDAQKLLKTLPIYYINTACKEIDETTSIFKRILNKKVGKKENNDFKDCLIIYDYLRLNDSGELSKDIKENQVLGFHTIKLKNNCIQTKIPTLTYVQANRDGISKEDSSVISGSDRTLWVCDSMALLKRKEEEEINEDRAANRDFNRKLVWIKARNAEEAEPGEYINYKVEKSCRLTEGPKNTELRSKPVIQVNESDENQEF